MKVTSAIVKVASATMKTIWVIGVIMAISAGVFIAVSVTKGCM